MVNEHGGILIVLSQCVCGFCPVLVCAQHLRKMGDSQTVPFLQDQKRRVGADTSLDTLPRRFWAESKELWEIAGPAIFSRISMFGVNVISQAFAGHMGDLELAAISIASTVVIGFSFGLMLGMASALETLCGQAYGARQYHKLGIYLQRSWIVLLCIAVLLLPMYMFATPILKLIGEPDDIAELAGSVSIWFIPQHFAFAILFPIQRFLQCQLKNMVIAWIALATLIVHIFLNWLIVLKLDMGLVGASIALNISWCIPPLCQFLYTVSGNCRLTWTGFTREAFHELGSFTKLSLTSGIMLCLENWYYRVLVLLTGHLKNPKVAVDSLSICMNISGWEMMIPFGFFAAAGVRISNELGAGNGKGAKFAVIVSVTTSSVIGLIFWIIIIAFRDHFAAAFTESAAIREAVSRLAILLAFAILLNSIQPVLSGVAVGSGWQSIVAYVNVACYYALGVPFGVILGWACHLGVLGIWAGMIGGTAVQTAILAFITYRCDWDKEAAKAVMRIQTDSFACPTKIKSVQSDEDGGARDDHTWNHRCH